LSPLFTENTVPTLEWNGLPEGAKNDVFADSEHPEEYNTKDGADAFGPKGQYGMWMGISGQTKNSFGCGPKGPMDCSVGTTPSQHWAVRRRQSAIKQQLSPLFTENTVPTLEWNGLPEGAKNDVFADSEHPEEYNTKDGADAFGPKGQYGMWMGISGQTKNSFGCGPKGPMDCSVGTTPSQHWARRPVLRPSQKLFLEKRPVREIVYY